MQKTATKSLKPRKKPVQERSGQTVEAIFEATIQVLLKEGAKNLTTTRVAERAGVSVGTLYQYFPNKEALLCAMLEKHLELIAGSIEIACAKSHRLTISEMMTNLIDVFVEAKMKKKDISLATSELTNELSSAALYRQIIKKVEDDITTMLSTIPKVKKDKIPFVTSMLLATMAGATRMIIEKGATPAMVNQLKSSLQTMFEPYVEKELQ